MPIRDLMRRLRADKAEAAGERAHRTEPLSDAVRAANYRNQTARPTANQLGRRVKKLRRQGLVEQAAQLRQVSR